MYIPVYHQETGLHGHVTSIDNENKTAVVLFKDGDLAICVHPPTLTLKLSEIQLTGHPTKEEYKPLLVAQGKETQGNSWYNFFRPNFF